MFRFFSLLMALASFLFVMGTPPSIAQTSQNNTSEPVVQAEATSVPITEATQVSGSDTLPGNAGTEVVNGGATEQPVEVLSELKPKEIDPNVIQPIVFTHWEHEAIQDARNAKGSVRPPTEEELMRDMQSSSLVEEKPKTMPADREIRLGGIVYVNGKEWSIWLNEKRVTPDAIPPEVLDLKVYKGYVEMKWFDEFTNRILPLRLRAHERFNIDTRIFLPG